jgi:hypothetical protein
MAREVASLRLTAGSLAFTIALVALLANAVAHAEEAAGCQKPPARKRSIPNGRSTKDSSRSSSSSIAAPIT